MKKILYMITGIMSSMLLLTGCGDIISTETENVEVEVIDVKYEPEYDDLYWIGNVIYFDTNYESFKVKVEYKDQYYVIDDEETYNKYSDKIGEMVNGTCKIYTYDDGSIIYDIIGLE